MARTMWGVEKYKVFHILERDSIRNKFNRTIKLDVFGYYFSSKELKKRDEST